MIHLMFTVLWIFTAFSASAATSSPEWVFLLPAIGGDQLSEDLLHTQPKRCPTDLGKAARSACETAVPQHVFMRPIYQSDSTLAPAVGFLKFDLDDVTFAFVSPLGEETKFVPDLYESDYGYGPWFHMTVAERRGDWVKLPRRPFPTPVWLQLRGKKDAFFVLKDNASTTYIVNGGMLWLDHVDNGQAYFRPPHPSDMPCDPDEVPTTVPVGKVTPTPFSQLYDEEGHLKIAIAYSRGC